MNGAFLIIMFVIYVGVLLCLMNTNSRNKKELSRKNIVRSIIVILCAIVLEALYVWISGRLLSELLYEKLSLNVLVCNIVINIPVILIRFFAVVLIVKLIGKSKISRWVYIVLAASMIITVSALTLDDIHYIKQIANASTGSFLDMISVQPPKLGFLRAERGCLPALVAGANAIMNNFKIIS